MKKIRWGRMLLSIMSADENTDIRDREFERNESVRTMHNAKPRHGWVRTGVRLPINHRIIAKKFRSNITPLRCNNFVSKFCHHESLMWVLVLELTVTGRAWW
jgi:hypothetical protein